MKVKHLESILTNVAGFEKPKIKFEQYTTSPHIAANVVHSIGSYIDCIENKSLIDLGTGPGILAIASSLIGFNYVLGVDIDRMALKNAQTNIEMINEGYNVGLIDFLQADITKLKLSSSSSKMFDVVLMNPPFGTKCNKGIDVAFLKVALSLADSVYSLHKSSTREYLMRKTEEWSVEAQVLYQVRYDLPATYTCHKKCSIDIDVDFLYFSSCY